MIHFHGDQFMVEFENDHFVMNESQLIDFIKIAVINNQDISNFEVHRIQDVEVDEYGQAHYVF